MTRSKRELPASKSSSNSARRRVMMSSVSSTMRSLMLMRSATTSCESFTLLRDSTALERLDDGVERHLGERRQPGLDRLLDGAAAEEDVAPRHAAGGEVDGRLLVLLVLEEPPDERLARIFLLVERVVLLTGGRRGEQHLRLDVRERRRHHEVLARDVEVHQLHHGQVFEVLLRHEADGDLQDVQLVLLAEVQEQIERPFEARQADGVLRPTGQAVRLFGDQAPSHSREARGRQWGAWRRRGGLAAGR